MTTRIGIAATLLFVVAAPALAGSGAVTVSTEEAQRLIEDGRMAVIETDVDAVRAEQEERRRLERSVVEAYLASHPEDETSLRPLLDDTATGPRTITIGDGRDAQNVTLQGSEVVIGQMAHAILAATDKANVLAIYARLYAYAEPSGVLRDSGLPTPEASEALTVEEIKRNTSVIVAQRLTIKEHLPLPPTPVESFPDIGPNVAPECVGGFQADAGNGSFGDQYTKPGQVCGLSSTGILANDLRSYRNHLSCVRHQAHRGTCGAFALASAFETAHSQAYGKRINLSEQMLYFRYKSVGSDKFDDDGMYMDEALARFFAFQTIIPFELSWNYNRSWDRKWSGADPLIMWKDSCVGYAEECSDTTPQGQLTCFRTSPRDKSSKTCGLVAPPGVGGVRMTLPGLSVWEPGKQNESIDTIRMLLDAGLQVTLAISVGDSFQAAGKNGGWLDYHGVPEDIDGGHAVHVVHYIQNDELAEMLPDAPQDDGGPYAPEGEVGGYFIVRNSWGPCWGDGGYVYIPYRWLRNISFVHAGYAIDPAGMQPVP